MTDPGDADMDDLIDFLACLWGGFVVFAAERAAAHGSRDIYYLSREGRFFHQVHERLAAAGGGPWPTARHLGVSRRSSFLAALPEAPAAADFAGYLAQYPIVTAERFLLGIGLVKGLEEAAVLTAGLGKTPGRQLSAKGLAQEDKVAVILGQPAIADRLSGEIRRRKSTLKAYLEGEGVADRPAVFLADIGWAGRIQDHLTGLLPACRIAGAYLWLRDTGSWRQKEGFLLDVNRGGDRRLARRLRFVKPFECLATPPGGSAEDYLRDPQGKVYPDYRAGVDEERLRQGWRPLQERVLARLDLGAASRAAGDAGRREALLRACLKMIERPPSALAELFLATPREEIFGAGTLIDVDAEVPGLSGFVDGLRHCGWPQALLLARYGSGVGGRAAVAAFNLLDRVTSSRGPSRYPRPGH
jgi:hypothetical protein